MGFFHRNGYYHPDRFEAAGHMATNDDEYNGYFIPKGTVVLGGAWPVLMVTPTSCADFYCLGPYYTILRLIPTLRHSSLTGI